MKTQPEKTMAFRALHERDIAALRDWGKTRQRWQRTLPCDAWCVSSRCPGNRHVSVRRCGRELPGFQRHVRGTNHTTITKEMTIEDLTIALDNRPGALAEMGEALGRAGVSIEGGGAWGVDGRGEW